ncbi:PqiC family protein [Paraburkholderia xenovorans]|uniref:PqiC family protein n=1 Tax=Paraburkholderia xenovorans TaxID=36873 RepID=UPI001C12DDEF|nr:PqiC family protein [Paraburkholderia xenovorans]
MTTSQPNCGWRPAGPSAASPVDCPVDSTANNPLHHVVNHAVAHAAPRSIARPAACVGLAALTACSSPSSRFYTLGSSDAPIATRSAATPPLLIEVPPVEVPPQVARTAFVVQTGANRVDVLEQTRWASLPADEIRQALSQDLTRQLGAIDVFNTPHPEGAPVYRVSVSVQRFESWPGSHALIDAVWSVRPLYSQTVLTCRSVVSETVASGYDALVAGHRLALGQVAAKIATGVEALDAAQDARTAPVAATGATTARVRRPAIGVACPVD